MLRRRSIASKHLHFHNPAMPIHDGCAPAGIVRLMSWDAAEVPSGCHEANMRHPHPDGDRRNTRRIGLVGCVRRKTRW